jgi:nucleoside-diphosphate-sugar epimerase
MKIVVIGGTGLIGSKTVAILRQGGHEVVAASPNSGVNTISPARETRRQPTGRGPADGSHPRPPVHRTAATPF